jgi:hypothetical protein
MEPGKRAMMRPARAARQRPKNRNPGPKGGSEWDQGYTRDAGEGDVRAHPDKPAKVTRVPSHFGVGLIPREGGARAFRGETDLASQPLRFLTVASGTSLQSTRR